MSQIDIGDVSLFGRGIIKDWIQSFGYCYVLIIWQIFVIILCFWAAIFQKLCRHVNAKDFLVLTMRIASVTSWL